MTNQFLTNYTETTFIDKIKNKSGYLVLKEHEAAMWLTKETLNSVDWLPADQEVIPLIERRLQSKFEIISS